MKKRLTALLLAALIASSLMPASLAAGTVHFTDVKSTHWAYPYVERAYSDGAIAGTGGDPTKGTGVFSPDTDMTYGQFLTMLMSAFYPDEVARVTVRTPWYAPAIQVASSHQLTYLTQTQLTEQANAKINRYNMAWILVKLLEDKGIALPGNAERTQAAARIGDWQTVVADKYWENYVSTVVAAGLISGVDDKGTFNGSGYVSRSAAAVIYTNLADKVNDGGQTADPVPSQPVIQKPGQSAGSTTDVRKDYQLVYGDGWDLITVPGYREELEEVFYEAYPRIVARWGRETTQKAVSVEVHESLPNKTTGKDSIMVTTATRKASGSYIKISAKLQKDYPAAHSAAHELVHVMQNDYPFSPNYKSTWWDECMADYGQFRYYRWASADHLTDEDYYQSNDASLRDWRYQAYGDSLWFFAYMDAKYPTTPSGCGLIDSIHYAIIGGQITSDAPDDPTFNAVVRQVTGLSSIEALRQKYVQELDAGTWTFNGFGGYADNYITENIPGVPNPTYPTAGDYNLCIGARYNGSSGLVGGETKASYLFDGDRSTKWQASPSAAQLESGNGVEYYFRIMLNRSATFDTYTLCHAGSQGNSRENTVAWRLLGYDKAAKGWVVLDEVDGNTQDITTRKITPMETNQLRLEISNASGTGDNIVRLYELELYNKG